MIRRLMGLAGVRTRVGKLEHLTDGQDLIEYALLIAMISVTLLITITAIGDKVSGYYTTTEAAMPGGNGGGPGNPGCGHPGRGCNPGNGNPGNDKPVGNGNPGGGGQGNGNGNGNGNGGGN